MKNFETEFERNLNRTIINEIFHLLVKGIKLNEEIDLRTVFYEGEDKLITATLLDCMCEIRTKVYGAHLNIIMKISAEDLNGIVQEEDGVVEIGNLEWKLREDCFIREDEIDITATENYFAMILQMLINLKSDVEKGIKVGSQVDFQLPMDVNCDQKIKIGTLKICKDGRIITKQIYTNNGKDVILVNEVRIA